ncbi:phage tail tube protein [Sphingobium sp. KCTC 72723]|uniref:phage tail tube protein n=1 Tax=Sphingobium sp. KCTC 72723 TaxID=2733867 RepID=UPI00165E75BC|nr:phage tail tube protein [Sphingobium sp. KCTC 72723]
MATVKQILNKNVRAYIGKTAAASATADFEKVVNENELSMAWSSDTQEIDTKEGGKITTEGTESYEFSFTVNHAFTDASTPLLQRAKNKAWPYQVRNGDKLLYSGQFIINSVEAGAAATSVFEVSYTLKNAGPVTEYDLETGEAITETVTP